MPATYLEFRTTIDSRTKEHSIHVDLITFSPEAEKYKVGKNGERENCVNPGHDKEHVWVNKAFFVCKL